MIATQEVMHDFLARIEFVPHVYAMVSPCLFLPQLCHYTRYPVSCVACIMHDAKYFVQLDASVNQGYKFIRYGGNGAIKLGFEAPPDVKIHRLEVDEEIKLQKGEVHHADNDQ